MNRLTSEDGQLYACGYGRCNDEINCTCGDCHYTEEAFKKLTAYEDTGLEPEEIKQLNKYRDELKYYKKLEERGLLVKLPCKVRDTVYVNASTFGTNDDIEYAEAEVVSIRITKKQTFLKLRIFALGLDGRPYGCKNYPVSSFGKTVVRDVICMVEGQLVFRSLSRE